jgi:hypothetical protein
MEYDFDDCLGELISSEQLNSFSVVDQFCESCEKTTPHHIDESIVGESDKLDEEDSVSVKPMSVQECVICARDEESKIDLEGF